MSGRVPTKREAAARGAIAWGAALTLGMAFNAALVVAKESLPGWRAAMASLTGHHWTTHGAAVIALHLACGALFSTLARREAPRWMESLAGAVSLLATAFLSLAIICAYYAIAHWG